MIVSVAKKTWTMQYNTLYGTQFELFYANISNTTRHEKDSRFNTRPGSAAGIM